MSNSLSKGVLSHTYADDRNKKVEIIFRYKVRARMVADIINSYFHNSKNLNILDFGSAEGLTLLELNVLIPNANYIGIEYGKDLINSAPDLPENIHLQQGDVTNLSTEVKEKSYDIVTALAVLEHLKNPLNAVMEAESILKPGGLFIASCPNPFWEELSTHLGLLKNDHHEVQINKKIITEIIQKAGLKLLKYQRFMWSPISIIPYFKIPLSPSLSLKIDKIVEKIRIFNWLFVNQHIIAQKK
ncbi:MAG: class I SAM-dependent methyltransferase [Bacteroidota bacterium]